MKRILIAGYGGLAYLLFLVSFVYMIGFLGDLVVPKTIDSGVAGRSWPALGVDLGLIALFGIQHSVMPRAAVRKQLRRLIPAPLERSTYVLLTALILLWLAGQWRPLPQAVWDIQNPVLAAVMSGLFWLGWLIALMSTFLINHFELFGLQQVYLNLMGKQPEPPRFKTPWLYHLVRHPLMLGLLLAFWAAPRLSVGHLLFAGGMTVYILIGIWFEERDLKRQFREAYAAYQQTTPALIPVPWPRPAAPLAGPLQTKES